LTQLVEACASRGWLNRNLRIRLKDARYRIFCSEAEFTAFRVNDNCGVSPGIPGWPVCIVSAERIIEDGRMKGFPLAEPGAREWLASLSTGSIELI
jgi:hypothetical protein